jgi:glycine dehydrogenase subunit 2
MLKLQTIFDKSEEGQKAYSLPKSPMEFEAFNPPKELLREDPLILPEVSEINIVRHFTALSKKNVGVDNLFYPLGSCTMKYNPKINDCIASNPLFTKIHPLTPSELSQGSLFVIHEFGELLKEITGMHGVSLLQNGGAQGEFVGLRLIKNYLDDHGQSQRNEVIVPDSAHGTNGASAKMAGLKVVELKTQSNGKIDIKVLKSLLSEKTAALMLTNPSTLGLFVSNILEIKQALDAVGAMLYYDGANLNPLLGIVKPYEMGFDVMHINLHKTFSTPHGGGGPGSAPVLCSAKLTPYLPTPIIIKKDRYEIIEDKSHSIGRISSFFGNFLCYLRAFVFIKLNGFYGLRRVGEMATLNANYLKKKLEQYFTIPFKENCMHEFVVQVDKIEGIRAIDFAKRFLDFGVHAPTIYFPLIVKECMLIEPTECESLSTLNHFIEVSRKIYDEAMKDSSFIKNAPYTTPIGRLNEVIAARNPILTTFMRQ